MADRRSAHLAAASRPARSTCFDVSDVSRAGGFATTTDFAQALLDESRVAVTPGEAFDAPGFVRLSYATSMETFAKAAGVCWSSSRPRRSPQYADRRTDVLA